MAKTKEQNRKIAVDLVNEPILQALTRLATPIMASAFLATAYNITDMAWIGRLGSKAVAGVGVGGMYLWLSQGLVSMARMGGQVNVAQAIGREDREAAAAYARAAVQMTLIFALFFAAVCLCFTDAMVAFFQLSDAEAVRDAEYYLKITGGCIIFSYMTQTLTGLFTAQGDSKTPFLANLTGLLMNMLFDPLLILGIGPFPALGVSGAAIATVFAQFVVMTVMLLHLYTDRTSDNVLRGLQIFKRSRKQHIRHIISIGFPTAVQGTLYCGISMFLTRMVSSFGSGAIAVQRVGGQIESLSWNAADGFAAALNAFTAQNYGAGRRDRVVKGYHLAFRLIAGWGLAITALFLLFPGPISSLFFYEKEVLRFSVSYLMIIGIGESFMCVELMTIGALSGLGKTRLCSMISILLTGARIPLAVLLSGTALGLNGIWWALTLSSVVKGIVFWYAFHYVIQKQNICS